MRSFIALFMIVFLMLPTISVAQDQEEFSEEQKELRADLFNFLEEEGFAPELDSDGDIRFVSDGNVYYFSVSKVDDNPMYVSLSRYSDYGDFSSETLTLATKELNLYKGVKVVCFENTYKIGAELFVRNGEYVKSVFYKLRQQIDVAKKDVLVECEKVASMPSGTMSFSGLPFIVTKIQVANSDKNGNILQYYGTSINSLQTQYLQPRITIESDVSGNYMISVKLYKNNVLQRNVSSSPEDCTYTHSITVNSTTQTIELPGWGSETTGTWGAGNYRYEMWYGDYCIGSKKFKIN